MTQASARLPVSLKTYFGVGQVAEGVKNTGFTTFLLFYYNSVLGLPGTYAGIALLLVMGGLASLMLNAVHRRRGEIAIRGALGAEGSRLVITSCTR